MNLLLVCPLTFLNGKFNTVNESILSKGGMKK